MTQHKPFLTIENLNENAKNVRYAVRGAIVLRAAEIEKELAQVTIQSKV
jgi:hypothetical protein